MIKRAVNQVHSNYPQHFLLIDVRFVQHSQMNNDLARFATEFRLKTDSEPAVRFVVLLKTARRHGVGKDKKTALRAKLLIQPLDQQIVFMIKHRPETDAADITVGRSINRVAERHVVSRHRLCDCARGAADKKEPACDFLAGANFREGPVTFGVEINLERFLIRPDIHLGFHNFQDVGFYGSSKSSSWRSQNEQSIRTVM